MCVCFLMHIYLTCLNCNLCSIMYAVASINFNIKWLSFQKRRHCQLSYFVLMVIEYKLLAFNPSRAHIMSLQWCIHSWYCDRILQEAYNKLLLWEFEPRPQPAALIKSSDWVIQPTTCNWHLEPLDHTTPEEQDGRVAPDFGSKGPRFDPWQQPFVQLSLWWFK